MTRCEPLIDLALDRLGDALLVAGVDAIDAAEATEATELNEASVETEPSRGFVRGAFPFLFPRTEVSRRAEDGDPGVCRKEPGYASDSN